MAFDESRLEILACPACKGSLLHATDERGESLVCNACRLSFEIEDGIPILVVPQRTS